MYTDRITWNQRASLHIVTCSQNFIIYLSTRFASQKPFIHICFPRYVANRTYSGCTICIICRDWTVIVMLFSDFCGAYSGTIRSTEILLNCFTYGVTYPCVGCKPPPFLEHCSWCIPSKATSLCGLPCSVGSLREHWLHVENSNRPLLISQSSSAFPYYQ